MWEGDRQHIMVIAVEGNWQLSKTSSFIAFKFSITLKLTYIIGHDLTTTQQFLITNTARPDLLNCLHDYDGILPLLLIG